MQLRHLQIEHEKLNMDLEQMKEEQTYQQSLIEANERYFQA